MDVELKQKDLGKGVEGLATDQVHTITIDSRCFEVTATKAQLDDRLDGIIKLEAGGQSFEKPLTDGYESDGILSFRFYDLPWGSTATVSIVLEETEDADEYTLILLKDAKISGKAQEGETPEGGTVEAPGSAAPSPSSGKATEPEEPAETTIALKKGDGTSEELEKS
jgi:hypothetical protein